MNSDKERLGSALLQLKACFWGGSVRPLTGYLEAPVPPECSDFVRSGIDWFEGIYPADLETVKQSVGRALRGLDCEPMEYRMVVENGGIVWVRHWLMGKRRSRMGRSEVQGFVQVLDERKRLEAECLRICEREKAALGQELHDDVCQLLAGVSCLIEAIAQKAKARMPELATTFKDLSDQLNAGMDRTRSLAHSLVPLRLVTMGLSGALRELASQAERTFNIKVHVGLPRTIPSQKPEQILHLYRIAQESISNAIKHGKATRVDVEFTRVGSKMSLTIRDNGSGVPTESRRKQGIGLHIMRYRAGIIGGQVRISAQPKKGTEVLVTYDGGPAPKRLRKTSS
ncbi:MAG: ATP-binding protein [Opitutaceae bacterium]